jgi:hypothetical protein
MRSDADHTSISPSPSPAKDAANARAADSRAGEWNSRAVCCLGRCRHQRRQRVADAHVGWRRAETSGDARVQDAVQDSVQAGGREGPDGADSRMSPSF